MTGKIDISPEQLAIVQGILRDHLPKGTLAWAFGSRVTWSAKPFSDLDIALEGAAPLPSDVLIDLEEAFEASDLPWKVDVIDLNAVSPEFRAIVEQQRVPADWEEKNLSDVFVFSSGLSKPRSEFGSGFPFLTFKDVFYNTFVPSELGGLVTSTESERAKCSVRRGDVFLTRTSETFDELGMSCVALGNVPNATFNGFTKRLRPKLPEELSPEYLGYYFKSPKFRSSVNAVSTMSTRASLNNGMLAVLPLVLPPLFEQANIAEVLNTLDDKIELNRRMNETLEAMARAVFRDWFVDFGPTRRKAAGITDPAAILGGLLPDPTQAAPLAALFPDSFGANGLPEGWEERTISDDFDVEMGQSPPGSTYNEEGEGLPFFQGRRDFQFRFPEKRVYCSAPTRIAQADWTLISVRAPVGDINRAWEKCCIGRGVGAMMHKQGWASFTYYVGLHLQTELASYDKDGTVFGSINQKQLKGLSLIGANSNAAKAFDDLVAPMDAMIRNNTAENQTLAATRDLLLPKLMSGELRLTGAEGVV